MPEIPKKCIVGAVVIILLLSNLDGALAQTVKQDIIKGTVTQVAEDGSYIMISGKKVLTNQELMDEYYIEQGDEIIVTVEKTTQGFKAISFEYVPEEDEEETKYSPEGEISEDESF